jgi:RNA polymerase sigma factor (sigma-70 family)
MATPDTIALSSLLDRYERPLIRFAQNITGDAESARDVVQEAFIKLARGEMRNGTDPASSEDHARHEESWLFTVVRNRALDHQRKFSRIIPMPLPDDRPCGLPGPSDALERSESASSLFRLLDGLSDNQREVILLKFQNDLSYREIAQITQLSVTNVGFLLHTGLKKLRELLREQSAPEDFGLSRSVL